MMSTSKEKRLIWNSITESKAESDWKLQGFKSMQVFGEATCFYTLS